MTFDRLYELFDRACDLSPEERAAFLDEQCADDPELRARIDALLDAEGDIPEEFLSSARFRILRKRRDED